MQKHPRCGRLIFYCINHTQQLAAHITTTTYLGSHRPKLPLAESDSVSQHRRYTQAPSTLDSPAAQAAHPPAQVMLRLLSHVAAPPSY